MRNIERVIQNLWAAWLDARSAQAKYYNKHSHIE